MKIKERDNWRENEASYFARCLLMPEDLLEKEMGKIERLGDEEIGALSKLFGVDKLTLAFRMGELYGVNRKKK